MREKTNKKMISYPSTHFKYCLIWSTHFFETKSRQINFPFLQS